MRVAFDVGSLSPTPTGVALYASSMARALSQIISSDLVLVGRRPDATGLPSGLPARGRPAGSYVAWIVRRAMRDAQAEHADVLHVTDGLAPLLRPLPLVLTVHDLSLIARAGSHPMRRWLKIPLAALSPRLAEAVIVPSAATAAELRRVCGVARHRIFVIPYAAQRPLRPAAEAEIQRVRVAHGLGLAPFILALGTLEPRKNHRRLIEAFEISVRSGALPEDARLVIAGADGWRHRPIVSAIERSPMRERIVRLGYVPGDDLEGLLTAAQIVAYVSLYEGFGLPVVEAMACGAAVVTSNCSSMPEVAGDAAFLVDPTRVESIAEGLGAAWLMSARDRAGVTSRSVAQALEFSWDRAAESTVRVYRQVLGNA